MSGLLGRARERFTVGDRVRLSDDGRDKFPMLAHRQATGVVIGFSRKLHSKSDWTVRIRLDETVSVRNYNARYFELAGAP